MSTTVQQRVRHREHDREGVEVGERAAHEQAGCSRPHVLQRGHGDTPEEFARKAGRCYAGRDD
eukprot:13023551-Heterocapsa_arctica.AAC.1